MLFKELERKLARARGILKKEPEQITIEDLDAVLLLARSTATVLDSYNLRLDLLAAIREFLATNVFDTSLLDANWDVQGQLPSVELQACIRKIVMAHNSRRASAAASPSDHQQQPSA
jgi:hypothetical protein